MHLSLQLSLPSTMANPLSPPPSPISLLLPPFSHLRRLLLRRSPYMPLRVSVQRTITEEEEEEGHDVRISKNPLGFPLEGNRVDDLYLLSAGLRRESLPRHVAVIMDGNRRWASLRDLPVVSGYEAGLRSLRVAVELCCKLGIEVLTVFAFSLDNWLRPKVEVEFLMSLFEQGVREESGGFLRENIRVSLIGDTSKLPSSLQELIANVEEGTKNNSQLQLLVAVSYSGQYDIVQACRKIALKVKDGVLTPEDVTESLIEEELVTNCAKFPHPDLLIRTSGELRLSNFFLWQLAYTELFFSQSLWPDFGELEFLEALRSFQCRQRRYGVKSIQ